MRILRCYWDVWLCLGLAILFIRLPALDLFVSGLFYTPTAGFFWREQPWAVWIYRAIPAIATGLGVLLAAVLLLGFVPMLRRLANLRLQVVFLLLSFGLGPGLLVNGVLKEHWGRARPAEVQAFGGDKTFTPAFIQTDQCQHNCSFVSGHAAQGFFFALIGFLTRRAIWFVPGLAFGSVVGLARIVQGRHFFSDVVFALFAVYFAGKLVHYLLFAPAPAQSSGFMRELRWRQPIATMRFWARRWGL